MPLRLAHLVALLTTLFALVPQSAQSQESEKPLKKTSRVLLLGQGPDGHPPETHEYFAGHKLLQKLLSRVDGIEATVIDAGEPWTDGPEQIDRADGAVIFLAEGAKWIQQDPDRLAALKRLAARGGGIAALHWGMGTRDAKNIDEFVALAGGCHGGPDRKYAVLELRTEIAEGGSHPITRGVEPVVVEDEFYYRLKWARASARIVPLIKVPIEGESHVVSWAWERPDKGRSFGFSGLHFHRNWRETAYRRLVLQGIVWTLGKEIPESGLAVEIELDDLKLPEK